MALHPKNGILIETGFVFGRKCTNRAFADVVVRMHEAKDERPFANHAAILIPPLARCLPDSDPSRKARRHRRGKKRRPLFGCDDAVWLRGPEVKQVSDRTLLARHAPGLAHGCASGRRGDKHGCRDDSSAMHSILHGFAQAPNVAVSGARSASALLRSYAGKAYQPRPWDACRAPVTTAPRTDGCSPRTTAGSFARRTAARQATPDPTHCVAPRRSRHRTRESRRSGVRSGWSRNG